MSSPERGRRPEWRGDAVLLAWKVGEGPTSLKLGVVAGRVKPPKRASPADTLVWTGDT